jgi:hypothetical protein
MIPNSGLENIKGILVTSMGFEPIRLAAPPPQDGESTNFSTRPIKKAKLSLSLL